jgi:hypothetical protein
MEMVEDLPGSFAMGLKVENYLAVDCKMVVSSKGLAENYLVVLYTQVLDSMVS